LSCFYVASHRDSALDFQSNGAMKTVETFWSVFLSGITKILNRFYMSMN